MLNRAIRDIHNLVRVHKVVGDVGLRQVLEDKLRRLNVRAALPPVNATTAKRMGSGGGGWSTSSAASTYTIEPNALCQLLECLAYTQFTSEEVTMDAIALAQKSIPEMNASFIAKTVAACCALGQHDASIPVIPMLTSAIHNATDGVPPASLANTNNNSSANVRDGADLVQLMEALHTVDVRQEELWTLLAEHCVRCLPLLSGKQLVRVAELLCERRVSRDGRDFFVAAEHHIANKPPHFLNADQLQRLTAIYSTLGLPTVALASSSSGQLVRRFDRGLTAMAHGGSSSSSSSAMAAEQHTGDLTDFLRTALGAFASASPTDLLELLQVCATKEFAHPSLVEAAAKRLEQLYFGQTSPSPSSTSTAEGRKPLARGAWSAADINAISQILVQLMRGEDAALYIEAAPLLSAMLNAMAEDVLQSPHHHRLLLLAEQALTYFPKTSQPTHLYEALVHHLRMASDMSSNEGPRRLQRLVTVLLALPSQGGHAVLEQHMPGLAVSIAHTPRRVQLSMAAQLCHLPAARTELLPSVFRSIVAKRLWFSTLTPIEARDLITSLSRSHARDQEELLQGLVQYLRSHKAQLLPVDITQHLHALALLGVREVEFFTTMAESLLNSLSSTQQPTTIHDLCLLLYTFTLVLNDVIRVVQQLLARTKVAVGQATPRDVVLLLYSLAALRVVRHGDVSQPFCQRATSILAEFSAEQLTSMWSSLRALGMCPEELWRSTEVWLRADTNRRLVGSTSSSPTISPSATWPRLRDVQYASLVHSILAARHAELQHNSAAARRPAEAAGASSEPMEEQLLFVLPHYQRIVVGLLAAMHRAPHKEWSRSDGLLVHGIIITLSGLKASLSTTEWAVLCATAEKCSEVLCPSLRADEDCRAAAAEVLKYLRELHPLQETPASSSTALSSPEIQACVVAAEEWGKSPPRLVAAAAAVPAVSAKRAPSRRTKNSKKR